MRKVITLLMIITLSFSTVFSQVYHREYSSVDSVTLKATSSAFVILDTANTALLFKSDGKRIEVIPIDATTMVTISPSAIYSLTPLPNYDIYLTNAFLDDSGDVVLYGYVHDSFGNRGMMLKYDPSTAANFSFMFMQYGSGSEIVSGCWGYDPNGVMNYAFVEKNGCIFTTDATFAVTYHAVNPKDGKFTHVTYDPYNKVYLGSGWCKDNIISPVFSELSTDMYNAHIFRCNVPGFDLVNGRTMHIQTDENRVFLCQDFQKNNENFIWMAAFDLPIVNIGSTNIDAEITPFKLEPITLIDLAYNKDENSVILLGRAEYCSTTDGDNFLMQENPYMLKHHSGNPIDCSLLSDYSYDFSCQGFPDVNLIHLQQVSYNKHRKMFFASGVNFGNPTHLYSTEFSNICSTYNCDLKFLCYPQEAIPELEEWDINKSEMFVEKSFDMKIACKLVPNDFMRCYNQIHIPEVSDNLRSIQTHDAVQNIVVTNVMGEQQFVCHDFMGKCFYQLYDMSGRLVVSGNTVNGQNNRISNVSKGIYILNIVDESQTIVSKKIVIE